MSWTSFLGGCFFRRIGLPLSSPLVQFFLSRYQNHVVLTRFFISFPFWSLFPPWNTEHFFGFWLLCQSTFGPSLLRFVDHLSYVTLFVLCALPQMWLRCGTVCSFPPTLSHFFSPPSLQQYFDGFFWWCFFSVAQWATFVGYVGGFFLTSAWWFGKSLGPSGEARDVFFSPPLVVGVFVGFVFRIPYINNVSLCRIFTLLVAISAGT